MTRNIDLVLMNKKKTYHKVDFALPADYRGEKTIDKYLDLARELKEKNWNMKVTMILIVVGALETVPKGLEKRLEELEIRERIETIQTTVLSSARIPRRIQEAKGNLPSLRFL